MAVFAVPGNRAFEVAPEKAEEFLKDANNNKNKDRFFERLKRNDKGDTVWETNDIMTEDDFAEHEKAMAEYYAGEAVPHEAIDWD